MQTRLLGVLVLSVLMLPACGKSPDDPAPASAIQGPRQAKPEPQQIVPLISDPTNPTNPTDPGIGYFHHASLWANHVSNSVSWTVAVLGIVRVRLHDFEQARDVEEFCPGYGGATQAQREICWIRLVGGIVEFESSFRPDEPPFNEGHGVYSVGLLALSTGECSNALSTKALMDPVQNLICGVNKMAMLISRGHTIDSPDHVGACAYWSTLRPPHKAQLPDGRWVILGKKNEIIARTKLFRQF